MPHATTTPTHEQTPLDPTLLGEAVTVRNRSIDRYAMAHDASHYLLIPNEVVTPHDADAVAAVFRAARHAGRSITFRSGGTSLSGQSVTDAILVDTRSAFRRVTVEQAGELVRVEPGATVRHTNTRLARYRRKIGPDPASEIACTLGGVLANNSSGMSCGIEANSYQTVESLTVVLPSGLRFVTGAPDADTVLAAEAPALHDGLLRMREELLADEESAATIRRLFSMKNTMGYGLNSLLDFDSPAKMLEHLFIGSEGTLGFIAEATLRTLPVLPAVATGLLVFHDLHAATAALPDLVAQGFATIELMDAASLRVAQTLTGSPQSITELDVQNSAALLVELHAADNDALQVAWQAADELFARLPLRTDAGMTTNPAERDSLWKVRKGLYTAVAGARPSGTTALLEDIVVPVENLLPTCEKLIALFDEFQYEESVIFGHAKDGNIHFLVNERFTAPQNLERYEQFTEALVELVLSQGGSLKAEHGTGRIMAPFVRRQYGDRIYAMMKQVKALIDPEGLLNPGVILSDDPRSYLEHLKLPTTVEEEVDRCVECGYCEPTCPSKDLTLTPRQRIVLRRQMADAEQRGDRTLLAELQRDYDYDGVQTCAVDGMCGIACPMDINTGDLVRRLRAEQSKGVTAAGWNLAAKHWDGVTRTGSVAMNIAKAVPTPLVRAATGVGRTLLGKDTMPDYRPELPGGGIRRHAESLTNPDAATKAPDAVFFAACIGTLFGTPDGDDLLGSTPAFLALAERAGITLTIPDEIGSLCCGTPWKSKGHTEGYNTMTERVLAALDHATDGGRLPIICDAASCTEGLVAMQNLHHEAAHTTPHLTFIDATLYAEEHFLPRLTATAPVSSVVVHPTCSTTNLGANTALENIAGFCATEVTIPDEWGCCGYAGDRGMLHPELTASATAREAAEVTQHDYDAYLSANRTCELGMTAATGKNYHHVLSLLEHITRP